MGILSGVAFANLGISGIAEAFQLIPSGLSPGNQYRLVFTTSGTRDATSTNIDDYNTFVTTQANQSSALTALGTTWTAIVSTFSTNALTNTSTDPSPSGVTGVPIYLVSGLRVADSYDDLWDGSIQNPIYSDETGSSASLGANQALWTGTNPNGGTGTGLGTVSCGLNLINPCPNVGNAGATNFGWISLTSSNNLLQNFHLYGISSVLTVPTPTATTPEPSSLLGFITLGGLMLGGTVRKAASNAHKGEEARVSSLEAEVFDTLFGIIK